jgi:hypothetical protein
VPESVIRHIRFAVFTARGEQMIADGIAAAQAFLPEMLLDSS